MQEQTVEKPKRVRKKKEAVVVEAAPVKVWDKRSPARPGSQEASRRLRQMERIKAKKAAA